MKVSVITRHAVTNYGSLLQALATQVVIEKMGHSCEIIDYVRNDEDYWNYEKSILKRKSKWNKNTITRLLYLAIRQPECIFAGKRFENERKRYLNLTRRFKYRSELEKDAPTSDVFITGSDQVWGPAIDGECDSTYMLSFTNAKKIAYAASFGHTDIDEYFIENYKEYLLRYERIFVREESAVNVLKNMGIVSNQVLDPTLLIRCAEWEKYFLPIRKSGYVLVYQLHNDKKLGEYASKVAKRMGLPLVRISSSFHQITREGKFVFCPEVGQFLSYIKNAKCLITDSFHGTAFAINFNTPFVEVLPNNNTGTRNISILKLTNLSDRILQDYEDVDLACQDIDFTYANKVIEEERNKSISLLNAEIKE